MMLREEDTKLCSFWDYQHRILKMVSPAYSQVEKSITQKIIQTSLQSKYRFCQMTESQETTNVQLLPELSKIYMQEVVDLILVIGGDSAVKQVAILMQDKAKPVLSISQDSKSMLGSISLENWQDELGKIMQLMKSKQYYKECLMRLQMKKSIECKEIYEIQVLSEVVLRRASHICIKIAIYLNDKIFTESFCDGLIIATPLGSTAYALNCGGPIVDYSSENIILVGINPLTLSFRPIVINAGVNVKVKLMQESRSEAIIEYDQKFSDVLRKGEMLEIRKGKEFEMMRCCQESSRRLGKIKQIYYWNTSFKSG